MAGKFVSERNLRFLLYEVLDLEGLTRHALFEGQNRKMYDMVIKAAVKLAKEKLRPIFEEMDREPPELVDGKVKVHPAMGNILAEFADGGWIVSNWPVEKGGEGLPMLLSSMCGYIFNAANMSAAAYAGLTNGAAHLIESFGHQDLKDAYIQNMISGRWQGTMALTEPEAGSSLGDLTTSAAPTAEGHYLIKGQKIFISAGDHNAVENVVHLMLARINGAPAGVKGISMFVVPKYRPGENDELLPNDLVCSGIYHKLGYRGCPIAQLSMGDKNDCRGWLVGEANKGLSYMFQMMNEARILVGLQATALTSAAYYASLDYAKTRRQGRKLGEKDPAQPMVPIIEHADIKRILLFQRAISEGSLSLLGHCLKLSDLESVSQGDDKERYHLLLDVLTPVMKSYPSEMGIPSISQGLQILGGSGYCDDYPLEQLFRDARIHPIHEGTTGIQGMDLLGRKLMMKNGKGFGLILAEFSAAVSRANRYEALEPYADKFSKAVADLKETAGALMNLAMEKGPEVFLADATLFLEYFANIVIAWQWLLQGIAVQTAMAGKVKKKDQAFYAGKMFTLRYYFEYELVKTAGMRTRLTSTDTLTVDIEAAQFND